MKNLGLKLLSLLLACILWWYVSLPRREQVRDTDRASRAREGRVPAW